MQTDRGPSQPRPRAGGRADAAEAKWIGAAEAARRLGIKQASLYSYVSRGVLTRHKSGASRASMFSASEVEGLARRGRPRRAPRAGEIVIETGLTEIVDDRLRYRGLDAIALATRLTLEDVAGLLWTGTLAVSGPAPGWHATAGALAAGSAAQSALPAGTLPLERLQVIVPALAATDPLRLHLDPPAVIAAARCLIAGMVDCLPDADRGRAAPAPGGGTIAARLARKLCPGEMAPGLVDALRAALVLLADHELAASTFAARVAASMRADPYAVVATGLGAVGGSLHGGASLGAEVMLRSATRSADAARVVGDLLRRGERIPGFGHFVYQTSDPRAVLLLTLLRRAEPGSERLAVAEAVMAEARGRSLPAPNIDFALAALALVAGMIPGAGEAMFAVARAVGWIAHALEEYDRDAPIRPRGIYTGPAACEAS
jgi:citrate synthase